MNLEHHHVGLSVTDLDGAKKWYADVLGLTPGFAFEIPGIGIRGCFMAGHGTRLELMQRDGAAGGVGGQEPPGAMLTLGFFHIAFRVGDLDAAYAEAVARGAAPVWAPRPSPEPGVRMAYVADPDGNLVEFISAATGPTAVPGPA